MPSSSPLRHEAARLKILGFTSSAFKMSHSRKTSLNKLPVREKANGVPEAAQAVQADTKGIGKAEAKKPTAKAGKAKKSAAADEKSLDATKDGDFPRWYQQVLTKGDMIDYYDVSGCFILKPASWSIWERVQDWFNVKIKAMGVENCAFPLFVSEDTLSKEKDHLEGFAAEVAWVTHGGKTKLDKRIAIRPTSETVMYPYYAKWIRSHRDLPLLLNQWNSVVRWEFKHPMPFLRTREFHWQEGHTAHLTQEGAEKEVLEILDHYAGVYEQLLAVPVIKGRKTENEKFAGAFFTTTLEGYIPATGRAIQGATSHCLGQNFSKMFNITVEDPSAKEGEKKERLFVWQNSWGLSTRVLGVMIMIHGDDRGLVIPPRVAKIQVVIVPAGIKASHSEESKTKVYDEIEKIVQRLKKVDVRVYADLRDGYSPGFKFAEWEQKGIPLRVEFGPGEMEKGILTTSRRDLTKDQGAKGEIKVDELETAVPTLLETIYSDLYHRADAEYKKHVNTITNWDDMVPALNNKDICLIPFCLTPKCEDEIKDQTKRSAEEQSDVPQDEKAPSMGAKSLCIPFDQPGGIEKGVTKCLNPKCENKAEQWCLFGRSY